MIVHFFNTSLPLYATVNSEKRKLVIKVAGILSSTDKLNMPCIKSEITIPKTKVKTSTTRMKRSIFLNF